MQLFARTSRGALVALAALSLVLAAGCGKETQKPTTQKVDKKADEKKADDKAGDKAAEKTAEKAPAPAAEKAAAAPADDAAAKPEAKPAAAAPAGSAAGEVVAVAGVPSFEQVFGALAKAAAKIQPGALPADAASQAREAMKMALELKDVSWLKADQPIWLVLAHPAKYAGGGALVVPISDQAKVLASLKDDAKKGKDAGGHAASYTRGMGEVLFVDFVEGHLVLSQHADVFNATKDYIAGDLQKFVPKQVFEMQFDMAAVRSLYAEQLKQAREMGKAMFSQLSQMQGQPDMSKLGETYMDMVFAFVEGTERVRLGFGMNGDDLAFNVGVTPLAGTGMAKFAKSLEGKGSSLLGTVDPATWFGMSSNADMRGIESLKALQGGAADMYAKMLKLTPEEAKQLAGLLDEAWKLSPGDGAGGFYTDGTFPLALAYVAKVTDATKMRASYDAMIDLLFTKAMALAKEEIAANDPEMAKKFDVKSAADLAKLVNQFGAAVGVKMTLTSSDEGGAALDAMTVEIDWAKTPLKQEDPATFAAVSKLGSKFDMAVAYKGELMAFGFGPNGAARAKALAAGEYKGGEPTLTAASTGHAIAMTMRIGAMLDAMAAVSPGLEGKRAAITALPKDKALSVAVAGKDGDIHFQLGLPIDLIQGLIALGM